MKSQITALFLLAGATLPTKADHHEHGHHDAKTTAAIEKRRAQNAEFRSKLGERIVFIDLDLLSSKGETTVAFIENLGQPSCKVMGTITSKMKPDSTKAEDLEKVKSHLQLHGYKRSEIEKICMLATQKWQERVAKPEAPAPAAE